MGKTPLLIFFGIALFCVSIISLSTVDASSIPDWVKNNAKWWAEGSITEADYISSLQYLINQGILSIPIPITQVLAANSPVSDADRAQSIVVRFSNGPLPTERPFTTFSQFKSLSPRNDMLHDSVYVFGDKPQFLLSGLPSKDKADLYEAIDRVYFAKAGSTTITRFDVAIDILSGDGTLIQTWQYNKCQVFGYGTFLNDITNFIPFSGEELEYREKIVVECSGVRLQVP